MSRKAPRFAIVERTNDGRTKRVNVILYHDVEPIIRLHTNCGERDAIGVAALLNDTIESVSILNKG